MDRRIQGWSVNMEVRELVQTCGACPAQWEFRTCQNRPVYVRYRHGYLSIKIGEPDASIFSAVSGRSLFGEGRGGPYDGTIEWEMVKEIIDGLPNNCIDLVFFKGD